jgi:hypothetical protein
VTAAFTVTDAFGVYYFYILCLSAYNLGADCNYAEDGVVMLATRSRKATSPGTWGTQPSVLRAAVASNCHQRVVGRMRAGSCSEVGTPLG